jgi:tripartite-type tricarboxylate transporter receptor subunit TctC
LALLASVAATLPAAAQQYPSRTIRVIVPFEAGGAPDIVARIVAGALAQPLGQSLIVENRTGANGIVGMQAAATAEPDGYTILNVPPAFVINPSVYKTLPFDIFKDFAPRSSFRCAQRRVPVLRCRPRAAR